MTATRPVHLRWTSVGLVALGGAAGTAARVALSLAVPTEGGFPLATIVINVMGAFLLGMLLDALTRRGPDAGRLRDIRLLAGTGALGGFTTYSALATDGVLLGVDGSPAVALAYALGTLVAGGAATWAGILISSRFARGTNR